ncbi:hypothetical protein ABE60_16650 [Lysinibacillus sphaericus]|nr:hypothetical protein [Lysinibacillus sphaericus]
MGDSSGISDIEERRLKTSRPVILRDQHHAVVAAASLSHSPKPFAVAALSHKKTSAAATLHSRFRAKDTCCPDASRKAKSRNGNQPHTYGDELQINQIKK